MKESACSTHLDRGGWSYARNQIGIALPSQWILGSIRHDLWTAPCLGRQQACGMANNHGASCDGCPICMETHRIE